MGDGKGLFPVVESPEFIQESDRLDSEYRYTVAWDVEKGDFVLDGKNRMQTCNGVEGYRVWCCKTALTQRYACSAYPDEIGAELDEALAETDEKAVQSALERTITEALMVNPRTEYVRDFVFIWNGDNVSCSFIVKGVEGNEFQVNI